MLRADKVSKGKWSQTRAQLQRPPIQRATQRQAAPLDRQSAPEANAGGYIAREMVGENKRTPHYRLHALSCYGRVQQLPLQRLHVPFPQSSCEARHEAQAPLVRSAGALDVGISRESRQPRQYREILLVGYNGLFLIVSHSFKSLIP